MRVSGELDSHTLVKVSYFVSFQRIRDFLIIEGLHSLYFEDLNTRFDLKVFLDTEDILKKETKLARDIERGKTEEDILEQINQREDDFFEYILPQRNSSDVSITTRSRLFEKVSFDIQIKTQYFFELQQLLETIPSVEIKVPFVEHTFTKFQLDIEEQQYNNLFSLLTKDIQNLKSKSFDLKKYNNDKLPELTLKISIILFLLTKKFENRL